MGFFEQSDAEHADVVAWFWQFVDSLNQDDRSKLLCWWTGLKRLPRGGWNSPRAPQFVLNLTATSTRLPMAHTCAFQIDLPRYSTSSELTDKLKLAMDETRFAVA